MKKKTQIHETHQLGKRQGISRREMVQRLMGAGAGSLMVAGSAAAQPTHTTCPGPIPLAYDVARREPSARAPLFLDPHQKGTLVVLAERIIPGSTKADVAGFVDLLLSVDTQKNQKEFLASLSAMDSEALRRYGSPFKDINEPQQNELLTIASTASRLQPPANESAIPTQPAMPAELSSAVFNEHFENLKGWVRKAYYSSEIGLKELGWTDSYGWPSFPGCKNPSS